MRRTRNVATPANARAPTEAQRSKLSSSWYHAAKEESGAEVTLVRWSSALFRISVLS